MHAHPGQRHAAARPIELESSASATPFDRKKTVAQAPAAAGYVTGHFGKWHLSGYSGPGVPILASDRSPGRFGFEEWLSVTNFFDQDPQLSREGQFEEFRGDSSDVIVDEAVSFLKQYHHGEQPMFAVVWFGNSRTVRSKLLKPIGLRLAT